MREGHVGGRQLDPVVGGDDDVLVRHTEVGFGRNGCDVGVDVTEADREDEEPCDGQAEHRRVGHCQAAAEVAPSAAAVGTSAAPQDDGTGEEEDDAPDPGQKPGVVVALHGRVAQVVRRGCADHDGERPERHRVDRADPGAQVWVGGRGSPEQKDRDQTAEEMVACRGAGLGLHEVVVEHMRSDDDKADHDDRAFATGDASVAAGVAARPVHVSARERLRCAGQDRTCLSHRVPLLRVVDAGPYRAASSSGSGTGASTGS